MHCAGLASISSDLSDLRVSIPLHASRNYLAGNLQIFFPSFQFVDGSSLQAGSVLDSSLNPLCPAHMDTQEPVIGFINLFIFDTAVPGWLGPRAQQVGK